MKSSINKKIVANTVRIIVILAGILVLVMGMAMKELTERILNNVLPSTIKTASQSIEGNIHLLADRIFMIGEKEFIMRQDSTRDEKKEVLDKVQSEIEFRWLGLYDANGALYLGEDSCPESIAEREMFPLLKETQNLVIDNVDADGEDLELAIGVPVMEDDELLYYLVGSYKYDVLNDVMSNINLSANAQAYLVNYEGKIMGSRDTQLVKDDVNIQEAVQIDGIADMVTSGETKVTEMKYSKSHAYVGYTPVNGTRWYLAVVVPHGDFMGPANATILFSLLVTGVLLIFAIYFTMRFSSKIQRSLKGVTERIGLLAQGDLTTPTEVIRTNDETELLSHALSNTVDSINGYISELSHILASMAGGDFKVEVKGSFDGDFVVMKKSLNNIIDALNKMLIGIKRLSEEVFLTANTVSESAKLVYNDSTEQSSSLNVLSDETTAIRQNVQEVDENTRLVGEMVDTVQENMDAGDENMKNLLQAMEDINRNSIEITKINKFLEDISFQTNILSLNASIEAARAGEAGSGFAIVAEEVRNLAAQSAESSKRTSGMISDIVQSIEQGTNYAQKVAESFGDIGEVSGRISQITKKLEKSVSIQKQSLENITGQITQIRDFAQQNLNASFESTTASEKLNGQAKKLQEVSGSFQLREGSLR
ncbi:MAG: hypothetical protein HFH15_08270 [Ruminococcus sp.]|nr:hypothetical protein [Ruminococcus sp.]